MLGGAIFISCSRDGDKIEVTRYLKVDYDSFSFDAQGTRTFTVTVTSSSDWSVEYPEWIAGNAPTAQSFTISTTENTTDELRTGTIVLSNTDGSTHNVYVSQGYTLKGGGLRFFKVSNDEMVMSPNGKYAAYISKNSDEKNNTIYTPVLINLPTGEVVTYDPVREAMRAIDIANNGLILVQYTQQTSKAIFIDPEGNFTLIRIDGKDIIASCTEAVSADGSVIVGWIEKRVDEHICFMPCRWDNGVITFLDFPDVPPISGNNKNVNGTMVRGCSIDGSILYGSEWTDFVPVVWDGNNTMSVVGEFKTIKGTYYDELSGQVIKDLTFILCPGMYAQHYGMSFSGRYLATTYHSVIVDEATGYTKMIKLPYLYDTQTGKETIVEEFVNYRATGVNDEGQLYCYDANTLLRNGYVYDIKTSTMHPTHEWVFNKTGVSVQRGSCLLRISEDGKSMLGMTNIDLGITDIDMYWVFSLD